jgi:hypothetical protein
MGIWALGYEITSFACMVFDSLGPAFNEITNIVMIFLLLYLTCY